MREDEASGDRRTSAANGEAREVGGTPSYAATQFRVMSEEDPCEIDSTARRRGRQVLRRIGDYWTVQFEGETCRLRDGRGIRYLAELLQRPGRQIDATALSRAAQDNAPLDETAGALEQQLLEENPRYAENARVRVTRAIVAALRRIDANHPQLGAHLRCTIRTGYRCSYLPDPRVPVHWEVSP